MTDIEKPGNRSDVISESQMADFRSRGVTRLENWLPADKVTRAREVVLSALERHGCVQQDGEWTFAGLDQLPPHKASSILRKGVKHAGSFQHLVTPELLQAIDTLAEAALVPMSKKGQVNPGLLVSLPDAEAWSVPHTGWHVDLCRLRNRGVPPGIQLFACLDTVAPKGGGTVVVAGSHRVLDDDPWIGPAMKHAKRLRRLPYFRDLMSAAATDRDRFLDEPSHVGDVDLQVVELCGEPGDAFLVDMRVLHTTAPNASRAPRLMVTQRCMREEILEEMLAEDQARAGASSLAAEERA